MIGDAILGSSVAASSKKKNDSFDARKQIFWSKFQNVLPTRHVDPVEGLVPCNSNTGDIT